MSLDDYIQQLRDLNNLTKEQTADAFRLLFACDDENKVSDFLIALHNKGESVDEVVGAVSYLRTQMVTVRSQYDDLVDCCGTGGDQKNTFNISTAVAFVLAGAGCHVAKHGNRAITSQSGSADVLQNLGIDLDLNPENSSKCINEIGITFLFAPNHHPLLKQVAAVRKKIPHRTIFNRLGPLLNPANVRRQLIGVYDSTITHATVEILRALGSDSVICVHGDDGTDEFSLVGTSHYSQLSNHTISDQIFDPRQTGYQYCTQTDLQGGGAAENAKRLRLVLKGHSEPLDHAVHINAAFGLIAAQKTNSFFDALLIAQDSISSGRAYQKLERLIEFTNDIKLKEGA